MVPRPAAMTPRNSFVRRETSGLIAGEAGAMPDLPETTWVKITGKPSFPIEKGRRISILKAAKIEKTKPPEETMLY